MPSTKTRKKKYHLLLSFIIMEVWYKVCPYRKEKKKKKREEEKRKGNQMPQAVPQNITQFLMKRMQIAVLVDSFHNELIY